MSPMSIIYSMWIAHLLAGVLLKFGMETIGYKKQPFLKYLLSHIR
jgi:hypothetical protein